MSSETERVSKGNKDLPCTSALRESPCLSLSLYALWDAPQMTQMALVIHERWLSLGSMTLMLTQNGSCFVRGARTRLADAHDIKHPALTTSFCLNTLLQDPNLSPFEQAAGLAYWLSWLLLGCGPMSQAAWQQGNTLLFKIRISDFLTLTYRKRDANSTWMKLHISMYYLKGRLKPSR